jgi:asparagine synthase (glutamine-hydrolysing)
MVAAIIHRGTPEIAEGLAEAGVVAQLRHRAGFDGLHIGERAIVGLAGRLDEPEHLARSLNLADVPLDHVLVYHAFARWGLDFAEHLQGDYSIFVWDRSERRLVLVRDHFGVEPLYYAVAGATVLFASEIKAIFAARPDLREPLSNDLVTDYVAGVYSSEADETIYQRVRRLPPGSMAVVRAGDVVVRQYYRLHPTPRQLGKGAPEEFAERLSTAVRRRMRTSGEVGSLLSGGLDSSSVTSLAARERSVGRDLQTFTVYYNDDPNGEEAFAAAVRQKARLTNGVEIQGDEAGVLDHLPAMLHDMDRPPYGPNTSLSRYIARHAASDGTSQVVLCGHGGDEVVSFGYFYLRELAQQGRWLKLWTEIGDHHSLSGSRAGLFSALYLANSPYGRKAGKLGRVLGMTQSGAAGEPSWKEMVSSRIGQSSHFQERYSRRRPSPFDESLPLSVRTHAAMVLEPLQSTLLEGLDHSRSSSGVQFRYPFWDKDVVEFAVSLPGEEKWSRGWPRVLLRRALAGVLPDEVAWRTGKYDFTPRFAASLRRPDALARVARALGEDADALSPFANMERARTLLTALRSEESGMTTENLYYLWRLTVLSHWITGRTS